MNTVDYGTTPRWQLGLRGGLVLLSLLIHLVVARYALAEVDEDRRPDNWVEMTMVEPPPPPPPEEPPPPEPERPKPKPKRVKFEDTVKAPPPESAPPPDKPVRRIQGLSASSFARGSGTGLRVRAGTTLAVKATAEALSIDEVESSVSYVAATVRPRCRKPRLEIPQAVIDQGVEGTVQVLFDVDEQGRVRHVRVIQGVSDEADEACIAAWKTARCKAGRQGDAPVRVTDMPHRCTFKAID